MAGDRARRRRLNSRAIARWNEIRRGLLPNAAERNLFSLPPFDSIGLNA
jgi:hypothetical protein